MTYFTLDELTDVVQSLPFFGSTLLEIGPQRDGSTTLSILDEEQERFIDAIGDIAEGEYRRTTKMAMLHIDARGIILRIEEPFEPVLRNYPQSQTLLQSLIGKRVQLD